MGNEGSRQEWWSLNEKGLMSLWNGGDKPDPQQQRLEDLTRDGRARIVQVVVFKDFMYALVERELSGVEELRAAALRERERREARKLFQQAKRSGSKS